MKYFKMNTQNFKFLVWGGCLSYDLMNSIERKFKSTIFSREYKFRLPTLYFDNNVINVGLENIINLHNLDPDSLRNLSEYQKNHCFKDAITNSDYIIIDLFKDTYNILTNFEGLSMIGPEFYNFNIEIDESKFNLLKAGSEKHLSMFETSLTKLQIFLKDVDKKIIFVNVIGDTSQRCLDNYADNISDIEENIKLRKILNKKFIETIRPQIIINDSEFSIFDENHEYGKAPWHLEHFFWDDAVKELEF
jgi:hypothetical protein